MWQQKHLKSQPLIVLTYNFDAVTQKMPLFIYLFSLSLSLSWLNLLFSFFLSFVERQASGKQSSPTLSIICLVLVLICNLLLYIKQTKFDDLCVILFSLFENLLAPKSGILKVLFFVSFLSVRRSKSVCTLFMITVCDTFRALFA